MSVEQEVTQIVHLFLDQLRELKRKNRSSTSSDGASDEGNVDGDDDEEGNQRKKVKIEKEDVDGTHGGSTRVASGSNNQNDDRGEEEGEEQEEEGEEEEDEVTRLREVRQRESQRKQRLAILKMEEEKQEKERLDAIDKQRLQSFVARFDVKTVVWNLKDGRYEGQASNGVKMGWGTLFIPASQPRCVLEGTFCDTDFHGSMYTLSGQGSTAKITKYIGRLVRGKRQGYGELCETPMGTSISLEKKQDRDSLRFKMLIEGNWVDDAINEGYVKIVANEEETGGVYVCRFKGQLSDLKRQGKGIQVGNNYIYEGEFWDNEFHGQGVIRRNNGFVYDGQWFCGQMQGRGKVFWPDGRVYVGEMLHNQAFGRGTMTGPDGSVQVGRFDLGVLHGKGEHTLPEAGIRLVGNFLKGTIEGRGELHYLRHEGVMVKGLFVNGDLQGKAICTKEDHFRMELEFKDSKPVGSTTIEWEGGIAEFFGRFEPSFRVGRSINIGACVTGVWVLADHTMVYGTWQFPDLSRGVTELYTAELKQIGYGRQWKFFEQNVVELVDGKQVRIKVEPEEDVETEVKIEESTTNSEKEAERDGHGKYDKNREKQHERVVTPMVRPGRKRPISMFDIVDNSRDTRIHRLLPTRLQQKERTINLKYAGIALIESELQKAQGMVISLRILSLEASN